MVHITEEVAKITECDAHKMFNNTVAIDTLILSVRDRASNNYRKLPEKRLCVLMVKKGENGIWKLPRTLKKISENLEQAAYRKTNEVVDHEGFYMEQLYSFSDSYNQDDSSVNISYLVLTPDLLLCPNVNQGDAIYRWFELSCEIVNLDQSSTEKSQPDEFHRYQLLLKTIDVPIVCATSMVSLNLCSKTYEPTKMHTVIECENIGFVDSRILIYGIERLRNKVEYTDIIFHLMPKQFTLTELQQVQELILDEKIYTAHFRRKIEQKLIKCPDQISSTKGHRPAQQYVYNPNWRDRKGIGGI